MKKNIKVFKYITIFSIISVLLFSIVNIDAGIGNKPDFDIEISANPTEVLAGEDITVEGVIKPKPFEAEVPAKEIILVLDRSGSMDYKVAENCKYEREERYCTNHNSSNNNHSGWGNHSWKNDYCTVHKISGDHYKTRMDALKEACNNFIDKMKDVENLKIGIVSYSTRTTMHNADGKYLIDASEVEKLKSIISSLKADGGTNTGEGLNRAIYLLDSSKESNPNANKSVILMSDGEPTYYTYTKDNSEKSIYYRDTDIENISYITSIGGKGSSDTDGTSLKYATEIGKIIKSKGYNVFSIGYGMDESGNKKMIQIHNSMSNNNDNLFPTSDNAINSVFEQIATNIINSYPVTNIKLNLTLTTGFNLNIGGNTVSIPDITYNKVSGSANGKIRYEAEDVHFKFIVKANNPGFFKIYQDANITFPWNKETEKIQVNKSLEVNILPNELPVINASLASGSEVIAKPNQDITVRYNIDAKDFTYNDSNNMTMNDIVIVLDVSKDIGEANRFTGIKNVLWNDLLNNSDLKNNKTRYALVTYNNNAELKSELTLNTTDLNDKIIKNIQLDNQNYKKVGEAFSIVNSILENSDRPEANKNIFFISSGDAEYSQDEIKYIKDKGYNIITLSTNPTMTSKDINRLHLELGGSSEDYFREPDANNIQNKTMKAIANRIKGNSSYRPYVFKPKLVFSLGDNFIAKSGFESIENNNITVNVPTITYNHTSNGHYVANKIDPIEFTITTKSDKFGTLEFEPIENNKIIYNKLLGGQASYTIQTPKITVQVPATNIVHGLDNGVLENDLSVSEGEVSITGGSYANLAAAGSIYSKDEIKLAINKSIDTQNVDNIQLFRLENDGNKSVLMPINGNASYERESETQNIYKININEDINDEVRLVIKYIVKIPLDENQIYTNDVLFYSESKSFVIRNSNELPDLF